MDAGTWRGIFTAVMLVLFIGICVWAWSARRRQVFDDAARLPLESDDAIDGDTASAGRRTKTE